MRPRLSTILAVLSALLCVAMVGMWVRGHTLQEYVSFTTNGGLSPAIGNYPGGVFLAWNRNTHTRPGFDYLGYKYGDDPLLYAHRAGRFAYRNDVYPPAAPGMPSRYVRAIMFPIWVPVAIGALACLAFTRRAFRLARMKPGSCRSCGYDLRATPDRCPECGAIPT
jgi:hypothetical protein